MEKVIVTGGTGFIGSWLIQELLANGIEVTAVVRDRRRLLLELRDNRNLSVIEKSIINVEEADFKESGYDCFFHMAWDGVAADKKNDLSLQLGNVTMSIHALEISKSIECKRFIAAGTVAEYVFCDEVMDVNEKQTPNDIYGAAKVSTHYFLEVISRQLNQPFNWIVVPSTFGERRVDNNIITYTIRSLLNGERPQYGNLRQMWDFLYVGEVVKAIRLIGQKGKPDIVYGIGSGNYLPLRKYIERIRDLINPELELGIGEIPSMSSKTFSSCVNIDDLVRDTGFKPSITFDEGIRKTIDYMKREKG